MMRRRIISILLILSMIILPCRNIAVAVATETIPACSCENDAEDLSTHADGCDRKAYCRELCNHTVEELYEMWGKLPTDIREFVLTYLSWTDWNKYQALNEMLEDFTDEDLPLYIPENPLPIEEVEGCICEDKGTYGSVSHDITCKYHFVNLTVEDEYIVYVTMSSDIQAAALSLLDEEKRTELGAYIAAHPFASTVSEDGVSVTAIDVPAGATITATVVDKELTESILPSITLANQVEVSLDIKVYDANGDEYQPGRDNPVMVKISVPETVNGQKTDIVHIMDKADAIEQGLADGSVKLLNLSYLFEDVNEEGEIITLTPELPESYWSALEATEQLGYKHQIAYEILTGICVDDGYSTFYTESFSAFSNGSLGSGTFYINHDLDDRDGNGHFGNWRGYYLSKDKDGTRHCYYYDSFGNVTIASGNTVNFIIIKGNIPVSGTITVNGVLNMYLNYGIDVDFWMYKYSGSWWETDGKNLGTGDVYAKVANTIHRASGNTGHLINVTSSGTLNLSGISTSNPFIIDGKSVANAGAAIVSSGKVNLDYVTINNNYKSGGGGAIILQGSGSHTLDYVNISNCTATGNGGALHISGSVSSTLNHINISNCSAGAGGGIYMSSSGSFTLNSSSISNCSGNGLYLGGAGANTITSCTISGCAAADGAAILIVSTAGSTTVNSSTITGNKGVNNELGGTVRSYGTTVSTATFNNCNIYNNSSPQHGGGFYWNAGGSSKLTINNCNIYNNSAGDMGGGIFCEAVMEIKGTTQIYGNSAAIGGGICVNAYAGTQTPTNSGSDLSLSSSISVYSNTSSNGGGGISMNIRKTASLYDNAVFVVRLNGAKIYGNIAATGGGIHIFRNSDGPTYSCSVDLNYGEFKDNTATSGNGGGVYTENVDVTIGNTSGTAMTISGNKAENGIGGAVYSTGSLGSCSITNGTLTSNKAKSGGAIGIDSGNVNVSGGTLSSNSAAEFGGAIYTTGAGASCTVSNGTLQSNSSKYGGAIAVINGNITVNGGTISQNTASEYGGGIGVANGVASVEGGAVNANSAGIYGGGIFAAGESAGITVSGNGSVSSNTAKNGGGIYATAGADVNVTGGIISYNSATGTPSATTAYNDGAASGVGGGIYVGNGTSSNSSSITISGSSVGLYGNTAAFAAADAYASGTYTVVSLPVVTNMNLTGYSGSATGWFEDYANGDTEYTYGFMGGTVGERYANARTTREIASASGITKYAAITLGTTKTGYGNLTIHKSGTDIDQDQVFIFEVTGNNLSMVVSVVGTDSITIYELPDGTYTVTEITSWSWRYTPADGSMDTTISGTNVNPVLTFSNTRTNNDWLSAADNIINVKG